LNPGRSARYLLPVENPPRSRPSGSTDPDRAHLERVAAGDRAAFELLYQRYYPRLFAFVRRLSRRGSLIEEVVDDTLLAVWRQAGSFDGRSRVSSWIFGIAYRRTMRSLERQGRRPEVAELSAAGETADGRPDPERRLEASRARRELESALGELPEEQRAVVELTFVAGLSYSEIAATLDCPVNTVKTRMFHARRRLRARLADYSELWSGTRPSETGGAG